MRIARLLLEIIFKKFYKIVFLKWIVIEKRFFVLSVLLIGLFAISFVAAEDSSYACEKMNQDDCDVAESSSSGGGGGSGGGITGNAFLDYYY